MSAVRRALRSPRWLCLTAAALVTSTPASAQSAATKTKTSDATGATAWSRPRPTDWVVVAPHPDDEVLLAGGLLHGAVRAGQRVAVIIVTNGDFECRHDGLQRERESLAGLAALGVPETQVYFLGYPDGALARLGRTPLARVPRLIQGRCEPGNTTYGAFGRPRKDFHSARHGTPATYTADNAVTDLALLLAELAPRNLVVTHPEDTHPDHAATYALVRRALNRLPRAPRVLRGLVHNGDCWPTGDAARGPCPPSRWAPHEPMPALTGSLSGYLPSERRPVPEACTAPEVTQNPKLRAIAAHQSQTGGSPQSYLFAFARRDEPFFTETFEREPSGRFERPPPERAGAGPQLLPETLHFVVNLSAGTSTAHQAVTGGSGLRFETRFGSFRLVFDSQAVECTLWRDTPPAPELLQRWLLPHDSWSSGPESFELRVQQIAEPTSVNELSLYRAGQLVGVAVDVTPSRPTASSATLPDPQGN